MEAGLTTERTSGIELVRGLALALIAEVTALSLLYDLQPLAARAGLAGVLGAGGGLVPLLFVVPLVLVTLRDPALHALGKEVLAAPTPPRRAALAVAVHLTLLVLLVLATEALVTSASTTNASVLAWGALAASVAVAPLLIARPRAPLAPLLRRASPALALGVVIGVGVWGLGVLSKELWPTLARGVLEPVNVVLQIALQDVHYVPSEWIIGTDDFLVQVAPICSGLEGVGLLASFAAILVLVDRQRWSWLEALALVLGAACLAWGANILRIIALVLLGDAGFESVAIGGFHSKAGWLLYSTIGLGMFAYVRREGRPEAATGTRAAEVFVLPVTAFVGARLVAGLTAHGGFEPLYGVAVLVGALALAYGLRAARRRGVALSDPEPRAGPWVPIALGALAYALWFPLVSPPVSPALEGALADLPPAAAVAWVIARLVGGVLVVPWVEELAFRGYLLRRLRSRDWATVPFGQHRLLASALAAVAFGLLHDAFVAATLAGLLYGFAQAYGRSVRAAVWAHATTNALIAVEALATSLGAV